MVENHALFVEVVVPTFLSAHEVVVVPTIADAKVQYGEDFEVILVDYDLDDGKGDAFVRWLRSEGATQPIVAISAHDEGNRRLRLAGAHSVCAKRDFATVEAHLRSR